MGAHHLTEALDLPATALDHVLHGELVITEPEHFSNVDRQGLTHALASDEGGGLSRLDHGSPSNDQDTAGASGKVRVDDQVSARAAEPCPLASKDVDGVAGPKAYPLREEAIGFHPHRLLVNGSLHPTDVRGPDVPFGLDEPDRRLADLNHVAVAEFLPPLHGLAVEKGAVATAIYDLPPVAAMLYDAVNPADALERKGDIARIGAAEHTSAATKGVAEVGQAVNLKLQCGHDAWRGQGMDDGHGTSSRDGFASRMPCFEALFPRGTGAVRRRSTRRLTKIDEDRLRGVRACRRHLGTTR
jgi:hypothetical protein